MRAKLNSLTGLRFFAAALIVFHHTKGLFLPSAYIAQRVDTDYGVTFFYVLSGFILTYGYSHLDTLEANARFIVARIARIWPLHLFTLAIVLLLFRPPWGYPGDAQPVLKFLANAFLLQGWIPWAKYFFSFNGVSWSLSVELFFYLFFPFFLLALRRSVWLLPVVSCAAALALALAADRLKFPDLRYGDPKLGPTVWIDMTFPIMRLPEFLVGMLTARIWFASRRHAAGSAVAWTVVETIALGGVILVLVDFYALVSRAGLGSITTAWLVRAAPAPVFAFLIFTFAFGRGLVSRLVGSAPLVFLGEISFSIYMIHEILARLVASRFPELIFRGQTWTGFLLFWAAVLGLSTISWWLVEKPCRKAIVAAYDARQKLRADLPVAG
ncbi:MAG TPA: acyltransferase [Rhizomicrobium sp.]|jgi:peptidoglycan/LPS O-acetylase OafA/YrhL